MTDEQFRAFLDLMMCSDPWPIENDPGEETLIEFANQESSKRGWDSWIVAYHEHMKKGRYKTEQQPVAP